MEFKAGTPVAWAVAGCGGVGERGGSASPGLCLCPKLQGENSRNLAQGSELV